LTLREQQTARRLLKQHQVMRIERKGIPPILRYKVDVETLLVKLGATPQQIDLLKSAETAESIVRKTHKARCGKRANTGRDQSYRD